MPTFTIISCAAAVVRAGATPVLVDVDPLTWNMDVARLEELVTPRTRAIMVVHIFGLPVDMDPVIELARSKGIRIIEDAAQAHGQCYRGRPCGTLGDIATFSFYPNKHVTTGEGGMLTTDDPDLADRCRSLRNLCFKPEQRFAWLSWNASTSSSRASGEWGRVTKAFSPASPECNCRRSPRTMPQTRTGCSGSCSMTRSASTPAKRCPASRPSASAAARSSGRCTSSRCSASAACFRV
jgi:hypothetical protein